MDNVFIYQSVELPDFARSPKGTIAVFFCEWDKLQKAQNRITGKFKSQSLKVKGACSIKSFNSIDPDTGQGFKVLMAEVVKPIAARRQRGRPLGGKNKMIPLPTEFDMAPTVNAGVTVTPVSHHDASAIVSPTPDNTEMEANLTAKSKDLFDQHLADVTDPSKRTIIWPLY